MKKWYYKFISSPSGKGQIQVWEQKSKYSLKVKIENQLILGGMEVAGSTNKKEREASEIPLCLWRVLLKMRSLGKQLEQT